MVLSHAQKLSISHWHDICLYSGICGITRKQILDWEVRRCMFLFQLFPRPVKAPECKLLSPCRSQFRLCELNSNATVFNREYKLWNCTSGFLFILQVFRQTRTTLSGSPSCHCPNCPSLWAAPEDCISLTPAWFIGRCSLPARAGTEVWMTSLLNPGGIALAFNAFEQVPCDKIFPRLDLCNFN